MRFQPTQLDETTLPPIKDFYIAETDLWDRITPASRCSKRVQRAVWSADLKFARKYPELNAFVRPFVQGEISIEQEREAWENHEKHCQDDCAMVTIVRFLEEGVITRTQTFYPLDTLEFEPEEEPIEVDPLDSYSSPRQASGMNGTDLQQLFGEKAHAGDDEARIRRMFLDFATVLEGFLPEGRGKALTMTKLQEAMFWAIEA